MGYLDGKISIDTALAFLFGVIFIAIMLVFAVAVPTPTEFAAFIFRVVLALAAAGVGAVLPGLLEFKITGLRAGGAMALAAVVYFINPPSLIHDTAERKARASLNDAYTYIARGNLELARDHVEMAKIITPEPIDVPFSWASSKRGSISLGPPNASSKRS